MYQDTTIHDSEPLNFWRTRFALGFIVMGAIAGYLLLSEHRAHFLGALPLLLLLACPVMHVFMHHGHGGHDDGQNHQHYHGGDSASTAFARPPAPKTGEES